MVTAIVRERPGAGCGRDATFPVPGLLHVLQSVCRLFPLQGQDVNRRVSRVPSQALSMGALWWPIGWKASGLKTGRKRGRHETQS